MPSKTFYNLEKAKQDTLIKYALQEFANNKYHEVSINKIINLAGISRGSFYMYFKDKEDLFDYLSELQIKEINTIIKDTLKETNGNLYKTFKKLFVLITKKYYREEQLGIFKNIFIFKSLRHKKPQKENNQLFIEIQNLIDSTKLKNNDIEFIFTMLIHNLFLSIEEFFLTKDFLKVKNKYFKKLDIICYGIYKEEK